MTSYSFPEYYVLLDIDQTATTEDVRAAYKRESLRTHPDRLINATPEQKKLATAKFQAVADAYYVLSDPTRRREYDALLATHTAEQRTTEPAASNWFFTNLANWAKFASGARTQASAGEHTGFQEGGRPDAESVFGNVFEEMLRPEVQRLVHWWTYLGMASGAGLGFIVANIPGMLVGGYAGNRLGAIRDAKGKSVAEVFSQMGSDQKAEILKALATKVLGSF